MQSCLFCGQESNFSESFPQRITSTRIHFACSICGHYYLPKSFYLVKVRESLDTGKLRRVAALLCERRLRALPPYELLFGNASTLEESDSAESIQIDDLLKNWPEAVADRINRGFCNLINYSTDRVPVGEIVNIEPGRETQVVFFSDSEPQKSWFIKTMVRYEWLEELAQSSNNSWMVRITPEGWAHFDELNRGRANARNPVFVAMWFGGKESAARTGMTDLFENIIKPAVKAAGYSDAMRSDSDEYNDAIMDRIVFDIRRAPFVVAELSNHNNGVYYESGYARGLGTPVIYCCKQDVKVHFDLTGVNHVRFTDEDDLRRKLENRILGSIGKGPS